MTAPSTFRPKSDLLSVLVERGYLHQCTDLERLDARAATGVVTGYIGFDATASSLHVGSLLVIMLLRRMQQTGHKPIVVMGGGTTKVGDPSGKDTQRVMLDDAGIAANIASLKRAFEPFLTFGAGPSDALMVDNDSWLSTFGYVEFLREYGPHFTINRMLTFDSVKLRLEREQPLSFLEFNYMLMQAVDFLELSRRHACDLQLGGSDQWGNIVNGVELIRRKDAREAFGFTAPLITTSSGVKMGKTADGAVWLNADLRSPYDYWQFWRNTEDADVGRFLKLFTDLPLDEIARLDRLQGAEINEAKKVLADAATAMLHGAAGLATARSTTSGATLAGLESFDLHWDGGEGWTARHASALIVAAKLAPSLKQARQRIEQGVRINDHLIKSDDALTLDQQLEGGRGFKVQVGKRIVLVRPV